MGFGVSYPEFQSRLHLLLAVHAWGGDLPSLGISCLIAHREISHVCFRVMKPKVINANTVLEPCLAYS